MMGKRYLWGLGIILALITGAAVGWWFSYPTTSELVLSAESCDLNQVACTTSESDGLAIQLTLTPKPVPTLKPIMVSAELSGFTTPPTKIQFVLEGRNMYMGFQKAWLERQGSSFHYTGTVLIPTCEQSAMEWKVTLLMPPNQPIHRAEFYMQTQHTR